MSSVSELSSFNDSVLPAWHFQNILGSGKDAMQAFHKRKVNRVNGYFKSLNISLYLMELISVIFCIYTG